MVRTTKFVQTRLAVLLRVLVQFLCFQAVAALQVSPHRPPQLNPTGPADANGSTRPTAETTPAKGNVVRTAVEQLESNSSQCDFPVRHSPQRWLELNGTEYLFNKMVMYGQERPDGVLSTDYLRDLFPNEPESNIGVCDGSGLCVIPDCTHLNQNLTKEVREMESMISSQIANYNNVARQMMHLMYTKIEEMKSDAVALLPEMTHQNEVQQKLNRIAAENRARQLQIQVISQIFLQISGVMAIGSSGPGLWKGQKGQLAPKPNVQARASSGDDSDDYWVTRIGANETTRVAPDKFGKFYTELAKSLKHRVWEPQVLKRNPFTVALAIFSTIFAAIGVGLGFMASQIDIEADDYLEDEEIPLIASLRKARDEQMNFARDDLAGILAGYAVGQDDGEDANVIYHLATVFETGMWLEPMNARLEDFRLHLDKAYSAIALHYFWTLERVYVVMADASMGCLLDNRGTLDARVYLPDRPEKSFWIYWIDPSYEETQKKDGNLGLPAGWMNLTGEADHYGGLTKEEVIRGSLNWYEAFGNVDADQELKVSYLFNDTKGLADYLVEIGNTDTLPMGLIAMPIAKDPSGASISSIGSLDSKNYPCIQGEFDPATGLGYPDKFDEVKPFLNRTRLWASDDMQDFCHAQHDQDETVKYEGFTGEDLLGDDRLEVARVHPFKKKFQPTHHRHCDNQVANVTEGAHGSCTFVMNAFCDSEFKDNEVDREACKDGRKYINFWWSEAEPKQAYVNKKIENGTVTTGDLFKPPALKV